MNDLIQNYDFISEKVYLVEEIFGVSDLLKAKTQIKCPQSAFHFVNDQELTPEFEEDLVNFCFYFIANVVNFMVQSKEQTDENDQ